MSKLPEGWEYKKLKDLGVCITGLTYKPEDVTDQGGLLVLRSSNVQSGRVDLSDCVYVNAQVKSGSRTREGDILICVRNGSKSLIGKSAVIDKASEGVAHGAFMTLFRSKYGDFVRHFFNTDNYYREVNKNLGATINSINSGDLYGFKFPFPPKGERERISLILSTWDEAISTTERIVEVSQQQRHALKQQLLTGKRRLPGFVEEWRLVKVGDVAKRVSEKNYGQSDNVVTISGKRGLIRQTEFFSKSVASETLDGYTILRKGQFAYNKSYSDGYPMGAIKRLNLYDDAVVTSLYICFEVHASDACEEFMEHYFESGVLNRGLKRVAAEGGRAHGLLNVKPSDFFDLKLALPPKEEQKAIAKVLSHADAEIEAQQRRLDCLRREKKALMQQLLTGKRRVKVKATAPTEEAAC